MLVREKYGEPITISQRDVENYHSDKHYEGSVLNTVNAAMRLHEKQSAEQDVKYGDLPWIELHDMFEFRGSEVTMWSAESNVGKSFLVGFIQQHLAMQKIASVNCSLEMPVEDTFERQVQTHHGLQRASTDEEQIEFAELAWQMLFYYDFVGYMKPIDVYKLIEYCSEKLNTKHVIIDSLMMINLSGANKFDQQKDFVATLMTLAKKFKIHVHLVTHMRKSSGHSNKRSQDDVSGAKELVNLVSNLFFLENFEGEEEETRDKKLLSLVKQRNGRGRFKDFCLTHAPCGQYLRKSMRMETKDLARACYF